MQPMVVYPNQGQVQTATIVQTVPPPKKCTDCYRCGAQVFGLTQVAFGILAIFFQIEILIVKPSKSLAAGICIGIFFIISGSLGIVSAKQINKCWKGWFLCMSILSAPLAVGLSVVGLISRDESYRCYFKDFYEYDDQNNYIFDAAIESRYEECLYRKWVDFAAALMLIGLGVFNCLTAIISSGFGCGGLCCWFGPTNYQRGPVQTTSNIQEVPPTNNNSGCYNNGAKRTGAIQVIIGIMALISEIVAMTAHAPFSVFAPGIWTGIFFIMTGYLGIASARHTNRGSAAAFLTMNILSGVSAIGLVAGSTLSLTQSDFFPDLCYDDYKKDNHDPTTNQKEIWFDKCNYQKNIGRAAEIILLILGVLEFIITIVSSCFGCGRLCCCLRPVEPQGVVHHGHPATVAVQGGPIVTYQPQQVCVVQGQDYSTQPPPYQCYPHQGHAQVQQPSVLKVQPCAPQGQLKQSDNHTYQHLERH